MNDAKEENISRDVLNFGGVNTGCMGGQVFYLQTISFLLHHKVISLKRIVLVYTFKVVNILQNRSRQQREHLCGYAII